ncbi:UNVERIFIED_CONTAM: hypothetical protein ITH36_24350 [Salmonella enterica subsp. enterica serovar Weltevreden]
MNFIMPCKLRVGLSWMRYTPNDPWSFDKEGFRHFMVAKNFTAEAKYLHRLIAFRLLPVHHFATIVMHRAALLFSLFSAYEIDIMKLMFANIHAHAAKYAGMDGLPYGGIITELHARNNVEFDESDVTRKPPPALSPKAIMTETVEDVGDKVHEPRIPFASTELAFWQDFYTAAKYSYERDEYLRMRMMGIHAQNE